ncbi:MAG TPA: hypothetical protein VD770_04640, partial [Coxiellaceae bacterium]|nr:hypothetical protein [Coxiellaceae bacterium]
MRIWKTSDSDLELDKIKEEIMSQLASISDKEAFKLVADIIKDLEAHPNLTTINTFLERFNCLKGDIALSLTDINRHLLKLKSFFSSFSSSHVYSSEDIASSHSFAGFSATHSPLINETVSSQGSYRIQPTSKEIANGLKTYERSNRPSVQFIDETGEDSILCFERSDQETISPSQAEFSQQIFKFCNKDLSATYFLCANLGIEALSFIACENINTLNAAESYISIFSADYYTL